MYCFVFLHIKSDVLFFKVNILILSLQLQNQFQLTSVISCCQYLDVLSESEDGASGGEEGTSLSNVGGSIV